MVQYIVTPWRNRCELLEVKEALYQTSASSSKKRSRDESKSEGKEGIREQKRYAVAKVAVWMQRGNCPHLVESTAILTSAVLNDLPDTETYCVRAAYAAAFCRFVTGLLDSHQTKLRKLSMYSIAKSIGLPATYVELRHQATHEELPSLSKLRIATQKALSWIWEYYWVHLEDKEDAIGDRHFIDQVRKLVAETDENIRTKMTKALGKQWGKDEVLEALMNIQDSTSDTPMLLRISSLQSLFFDDSEDVPDTAETIKDLEIVKAELDKMEFDLDTAEASKGIPARTVSNITEDGGKGWEMWDGPWIPKPIGVV